MTTDAQAVAQVVARVVNRYASNTRWWAARDELRQEAWAAVLAARASWSPDKGEFAGYAHTAVRRALAHFTLSMGAPVTASWSRHAKVLVGIRREGDDAFSGVVDSSPSPEERTAEAEWRAKLRERIAEAARDEADGLASLLAEDGPRLSTLDDPVSLYRARARAKRCIAADEEIARLWSEGTTT